MSAIRGVHLVEGVDDYHDPPHGSRLLQQCRQLPDQLLDVLRDRIATAYGLLQLVAQASQRVSQVSRAGAGPDEMRNHQPVRVRSGYVPRELAQHGRLAAARVARNGHDVRLAIGSRECRQAIEYLLAAADHVTLRALGHERLHRLVLFGELIGGRRSLFSEPFV